MNAREKRIINHLIIFVVKFLEELGHNFIFKGQLNNEHLVLNYAG